MPKPAVQHEVDLEWRADDSSEVANTGYVVYRATSADGPFTQLGLEVQTQTNYEDTTVHGGTTYYYQVFSVAEDGTTSSPSAIHEVVVPGR